MTELTRTEYQLLELLLRNPPRVLTHSLIDDRVRGDDFGPASNALRVYVGYLRRKLLEDRRAPVDPHGARRRLRDARAVRLRARIAGGAGVAVALAVLAAAMGLYLAVRSDLRGQVDESLHQRTQVSAPSRACERAASAPRGRGAPKAGPGTAPTRGASGASPPGDRQGSAARPAMCSSSPQGAVTSCPADRGPLPRSRPTRATGRSPPAATGASLPTVRSEARKCAC